MALSRRSTHRVSTSIWPGFVDAMTALLLVMMFLLTIFMVVQFVLREEISGQESRLDTLTGEISGLTAALGLANARADAATEERDALQATAQDREEIIGTLRADLAGEVARVASFEARVASLLAARDTDRARIADLEATEEALVTDREAMNLALASARSEIDAQAEAARLAAARREALEALTNDLRGQVADRAAATASVTADLQDARASLSDEEEARLAEAAAAEALRARLAASEAELTAMSLSLEEQRARAEETLTLLAAAEAAEADLDLRLAAALVAGEQSADEAAELDRRLAQALLAQDRSAEERATLSDRLQGAQTDLRDLDARLAAALTERNRTAEGLARARAQNDARGSRLAAALAQAANLDETRAALAAAITSRSETQAERDRLAERLGDALSRLDDRTRELASVADALDAAKAARVVYAGDLQSAREELAAAEAEVASLRAAAGNEVTERDRLAAALQAARYEAAALRTRGERETSSLRDQLADALVRQRAAEVATAERLSAAERQEALLATARRELDQQQTITEEGQRRLAALSEEAATLRREVATLKSLLGLAEDEGVAQDEEIDDLTGMLNTALARVAAEQRRRAELESAERQRLERYQSEFFGRLRDVLGDREGVKIAGDRFVFDSEVLFPSGSARLSAAGEEQIRQVATLLTDVSDEIPDSIDWVIRVDGHTDDVPLTGGGAYSDNWELSQARALSVVRFMSEDLGFPPRRLAPTGFGEYRPIAIGTSPEARALNRRIELKLTER